MEEFKHYLAKVGEYGERALAAKTQSEKSASITIAHEFLTRAKQALDQLDAQIVKH
jgi:hypothetical protein